MPRAEVLLESRKRLETRKRLVDRVAASRYISKSARLRSLLLYLCDQVLEHGATEIHEQEVGHAVFERPADYDTISDNIVRVHASTLRKRLEQYFSSEGRAEPIIIEIPKGNYAPAFLERGTPEPIPVLDPISPVFAPAPSPPDMRRQPRKRQYLWLFTGLAIVLLGLALIFSRQETRVTAALSGRPSASHGLWSQFFKSGGQTDIVLDDEGIALYQELTGMHVALSDYFNRNYLRGLGAGKSKSLLDPADLGAIVLKRQSSYASAFLLWKLGAIAGEADAAASIHFARDYSFRELQVNNAVLIGNTISNPWVEAFQDHVGLRWKYDADRGSYYPVDNWDQTGASGDHFRHSGDGYATVALLPNLSGTGMVLILSSTGGAAMNAAGEFLACNECVDRLTNLLPNQKQRALPYFEALLRVKSRSRLTRDTSIVICRKPGM